MKCPDKPWMSPVELGQVETLFALKQPRRVLEWGSGASTLYFPERYPCITRWLAIEHSAAWCDMVRQGARPKGNRVEVRYEPPNIPTALDQEESEPNVYLDYVRSPYRHDGAPESAPLVDARARWDMVLVDGRARSFCLGVGWSLLAHGGILVLHDAQRAAYRPMVDALNMHVLPGWSQGAVAFAVKK